MGLRRTLARHTSSHSMLDPNQSRTAVLCLWLLLAFPWASAQEDVFAACRATLGENDSNQDTVLSASEYSHAIDDLTASKIVLDMGSSTRTAVHQSFDVRVDKALGGIALNGDSSVTWLDPFCETIYQSFLPFFDVTISSEKCNSVLTIATAFDGQISSSEYVGLVNNLVGTEGSLSFSDLGSATRQVFSDFANENGFIQNSFLESTASASRFFCLRVILATRIDNPKFPPPNMPGILTPNTPTSVPTALQLVRQVEEMSESEYNDCIINMLVNDSNRDDQLGKREFVGFVNSFTDPGTTNNFDALPRIFQNLFTSGAGPDGENIFIKGVRPGDQNTVTAAQLSFLREFCSDTYFAVEQFENPPIPETAFPTVLPSLGPPTVPTTPFPSEAPSTQGPTVNDADFYICTVKLHLADITGQQDERLSRSEYVDYLSDVLGDVYALATFSGIDPIFQETFTNLLGASSETINIEGATPGRPRTAAQNRKLRKICSQIDATVMLFLSFTQRPSTTPVAPLPTLIPTLQPTTASSPEFAECREALIESDADQTSTLTPAEYVVFLNDVSDDKFSGLSFAQLDATLKAAFDNAKGPEGDAVNIIGARPQDDPSTTRSTALRSFCRQVYDALELIGEATQPTQSPSDGHVSLDPEIRDCLTALNQIDVDSNGVLDESEYVAFIDDLAEDPGTFVPPFAQLPYVLRDNYAWIAGSAGVVIDSVDKIGQAGEAEISRLSRLCRRTNATVTSVLSGNSKIGMVDHCFAAFSNGDSDENSIINASEFVLTVEYFLGIPYANFGFQDLEKAYRDFYAKNADSYGSLTGISVHGTKPDEPPTDRQKLILDYLCVELEMSTRLARASLGRLTRCQDAIRQANANKDNFLTEVEYTVFVYVFAGRSANEETFNNLPAELQANFDNLRGVQSSVRINGWNEEPILAEQRQEIDAICTSTNGLLGKLPSLAPSTAPTQVSDGPTTLTLYNGFVVGNTERIEASGLRNVDNRDLKNAYTSFVNQTLSAKVGQRRLRGRKLAVQGFSLDSVAINRIIDGTCPESFASDDARCQDVYGSFDLFLSSSEGSESIEVEFTEILQKAISDGDLQAQLNATNPNSRLQILGVAASNRPGTKAPTISPTTAPSERRSGGRKSSDDSFLDASILIFVGAVLTLLGCIAGCTYFLCFRCRKARKAPPMESKANTENNLGDLHQGTAVSDGEYSMYDEAAPRANKDTLLPSSDHSNEVNFGFNNGSSPKPEQPTRYSGYRKTKLATVPDDKDNDDDESAEEFEEEGSDGEEEEAKAGEWSGVNPWGANGNTEDGLVMSDSEDSAESDVLVEKQSPYRGDKEPLNFSRSALTKSITGGLQSSGGLQNSGSSLNRSTSGANMNRSINSQSSMNLSQSGHSTSGASKLSAVSEHSTSNKAEGSRGRAPTIVEEGSADDEVEDHDDEYEEDFEEEEDASQFNDQPQFDESSEYLDEDSYLSQASEERRGHEEFREEIEKLVRKVVPDEIENIDAMIDQFVGREEELIATLRNMADQGAHITESSDEEDSEEEDEESFEEEEVGEEEEDASYEEASYDEGEEEVSYEEESDEEGNEEQYEDEYVDGDSSSSFESDFEEDAVV